MNTNIETKRPWNMNDLQYSIFKEKYCYNNETFDQFIERVSNGNKKIAELIRNKKFIFAGRILANRGLYKDGIKTTYSNCYVIPQPEDSIEGIYEAAYNLAKTFSYGGGSGVDISKLRPMNSKVNNAAKTTSGAISFMDLFNMTTDIIGQKGRRGALMISMDVNHPDIEEFIDIKTDLNKITKANISVRINDEFMKAVKNKEMFKCTFTIEPTGETIVKYVNAHELFMKLCKNNYDFAEPGILYWDTIENYNLMSEDKTFKLGGVNPCAEQPLPEGGSCLLGSINLSEFVSNPYTLEAKLEIDEFIETVKECVKGLNEVLDEGLELHPLKIQKESVRRYRQIGLGLMGLADMLIKLGIKYGSEDSLEICDMIGSTMINAAVEQSALLAKELGTFEEYKEEAILNSRFFKSNISDEVKELVKKYGLRNSQLLTIAPTGSISTMWGISGGVEPIFSISYTRKTESIGGEDRYHEVFTGIAKEFMDLAYINDKELLPKYFITAPEIYYLDRIKMQSVWQKHIDAAISSTINLPYETSVEEVYDIYLKAWEYGLKGLTIYRDGCLRNGILITDKTKTDKKEETKLDTITTIEKYENRIICPDCGTEIANSGGCEFCPNCGWSKCQ